MECPECNEPNAIQGFTHVYCLNETCRWFSQTHFNAMATAAMPNNLVVQVVAEDFEHGFSISLYSSCDMALMYKYEFQDISLNVGGKMMLTKAFPSRLFVSAQNINHHVQRIRFGDVLMEESDAIHSFQFTKSRPGWSEMHLGSIESLEGFEIRFQYPRNPPILFRSRLSKTP